MALILPNSRDIRNKFLFGHFMMRHQWNSIGRKIEGPCYGRVNAWCSDKFGSETKENGFKIKLESEMDYMDKVGCNGYMIELCAHTAANEPDRWNNSGQQLYSDAWLNEVEEKYNTFLEILKKHKKMWGLVSIFNDNAWQREVGPDISVANKVIDIVARAGNKDLICVLPVGEPETSIGQGIIRIVHEKLSSFKLLRSSYGDESQDYWNWYSSGNWQAPDKKLFESSDSGEAIQDLAGYDNYSWVPRFPRLSGDSHTEKISYDYRGHQLIPANWMRNRLSEDSPLSLIYYAWGYDGNYDGAEKGDTSFGSGKVDAYAICGTVVGYNKNIPSEQIEAKVNQMISKYGIPNFEQIS